MTFGLTKDGFKIKRLEDILREIKDRYREDFGPEIDLSDENPEGQRIAIHAEREALIWELAQDVYNSQYPNTSEGRQLDNAVSITGTTRQEARFSRVTTGVARGDEGTTVPAGTVISVQGNSEARFVTQEPAVINIEDGETFKSEFIELIAEETGPTPANTGTLTVIETPISGLDSFTNEQDAELGSETERDEDLKSRRDNELQIAGAATIEAIRSALTSRPEVQTALVFQNKTAIVDSDGRPPKSLDIVILGDDDQELAETIFSVIGGGIETIGEIARTVVDSQGFDQTIKFSRPTGVDTYIEVDITKDTNEYPDDGDVQVQNALLEFAEDLQVGQDVIVYGSNGIICAIAKVPGILNIDIRIGRDPEPQTDSNLAIASREISIFDSARILVSSD